MFIIIGYIIVTASILGGYAMVGGHLGALYQPSELVIIGGAGVGALFVGNNGKALKKTLKSLPTLFRGSNYTKQHYLSLMSLLFNIMSKSRQQGMLSIEKDIESPEESELFNQYPKLIADVLLMHFLTDYLRLMISGNMSALEIESLMDEEIETYEHESDVPAQSIAAVGDALPAFGIVAAVMGVVHALASADRPPAELGELIAHAMVGTFLGILLSYGFVSPLATVLRQKSAEKIKMLQCIKVTLLANLHGYAPQVAVEFGRKVLYTSERPAFTELEDFVRNNKPGARTSEGGEE
ncbi:flagellar motor stator protein MotA [Rosenbergiella australiborealis]|uniref:Flagellar motor stator protein MotA n=1 Tax=Rosenbergiella australiborealis TaxID=1544696 RepID=A0ABS5T7A4_9GAMM|nr:flagellar motor stator protein MotA [Rosenbergiella australiborealis]